MGERVISQAEARTTRKKLRALRAWLFGHFNRKAEAVAHRYWHIGTVKLEPVHHGVLMGMREMARDSEYSVALLGESAFEGGKDVVHVYAMAIPNDGIRTGAPHA